MFALLSVYKEIYQTFDVPSKYTHFTDDGNEVKLGYWLAQQKKTLNDISEDKYFALSQLAETGLLWTSGDAELKLVGRSRKNTSNSSSISSSNSKAPRRRPASSLLDHMVFGDTDSISEDNSHCFATTASLSTSKSASTFKASPSSSLKNGQNGVHLNDDASSASVALLNGAVTSAAPPLMTFKQQNGKRKSHNSLTVSASRHHSNASNTSNGSNLASSSTNRHSSSHDSATSLLQITSSSHETNNGLHSNNGVHVTNGNVNSSSNSAAKVKKQRRPRVEEQEEEELWEQWEEADFSPVLGSDSTVIPGFSAFLFCEGPGTPVQIGKEAV